MIVEDDADIASMVKHALRPFECEIITARDGAEAEKMLDEHQPQLVILDLNLPFIPGDQLLQQIRTTPHLQNTRVIVVTVYGRDKLPALAEEADYFFQKPYPLQDFRDTVADILSQS